MLKILVGLAAGFLLVGQVAAEETPHRELGAHVHGTGTLDIAIEGKTVSIELVAPGMDVVGFEHVATSDEQKAAVEAAKAKLTDAMAVFKLPGNAKCTVETASAEVREEAHHDDDHDHDGHDHHDDASAESEHAGHSEFHAAYRLQCEAPEALTQIETRYFSDFPGAQTLIATIVTGKGQTQSTMRRAKPTVDLTGLM